MLIGIVYPIVRDLRKRTRKSASDGDKTT
jgi:hypothetical protein